jgi:hypothetical protein
MDEKLFEVLGKYAGLAGISVGLVLLIFRQILKAINPRLDNNQAYSLLRQLIYLTFFIGTLGIASWVYVHQKDNPVNEPNKHAESDPVPPGPHQEHPPAPASQIVIEPEQTYTSNELASGACKDYGGWATLCTPDKPSGWTIVSAHFDLIGDRAGCQYAHCNADPNNSDTKVCYNFNTQGHDEQCGHSGNTGIQYSRGVLKVVWKHPAE